MEASPPSELPDDSESGRRFRPSAVAAFIAVVLFVGVTLWLIYAIKRDIEASKSSLAAISSNTGGARWEYKIEAVPDLTFTTMMNQLGAEGWEAVSARRASDGSTYSPTYSYEIIFKRRAR